LSSCSTALTQYTVDPDFSIDNNQQIKPTLAIEVIAPAETKSGSLTQNNTKKLSSSNDFAAAIKTNIVTKLSSSGYRISANKFFNDFSITLNFTTFDLTLTEETVQSNLSAVGKLQITVSTKQRSIKKSFERTQSLNVPLTASKAEATGLANQVLGYLIEQALSDQDILQFMQNK
ncbi:MAG: YajG family lipoprotein, partial [Kangiellaceae bacterium]|nr:YajG family lipoprotein [Kangiellaceae bacterium]